MRLGKVGRGLAQHLVLHFELADALERLGHFLAFVSIGGWGHSVGLVAGIADPCLQCGLGDSQIRGDLLLGYPRFDERDGVFLEFFGEDSWHGV